ncbi:MAG: dockerin type I repeat-containing protein [Oscillospiraceae bacterium]|nr:dockerin type I repeat-containing protein [Oscillospiraceae bacterium]
MIQIKRRKIIVIFSFVIIIVCLVSASIFSSALDRIVYDNTESLENINFVVCNNQLLLLGTNKNSVILNGVSDNKAQRNFEFDNEIAYTTVCDSGICAVAKGEKQDNLYFYDIYFQSFDNSYTNHINLSFGFAINELSFAVDNEFNLYVISLPKGNSILKFSKSGRFLKEFKTDDCGEQLMFMNSSIYCVCRGSLYVVEDENLRHIKSNCTITVPCKITGTDTVCDNTGKLCVLRENNLELAADFNVENKSCCKTDAYYLSFNDNVIYGNSITDARTFVNYNLDFEINSIYYFNSYIYAGGFWKDAFQIVRFKEEELKVIEPETQPDTTPTTIPGQAESTSKPLEESTEVTEHTEESTNPYTTEESALRISSDELKINFNDNIIANVESGTTVSAFKSYINTNGEIKLFDKNNKQKTSGNVGTNMKAVFSKDNQEITFTVSVIGDLTGEGNVNSLDLNAMFNHLLEKETLDRIQRISGDLNGDCLITNKDLVLLERYINKSKN